MSGSSDMRDMRGVLVEHVGSCHMLDMYNLRHGEHFTFGDISISCFPPPTHKTRHLSRPDGNERMLQTIPGSRLHALQQPLSVECSEYLKHLDIDIFWQSTKIFLILICFDNQQRFSSWMKNYRLSFWVTFLNLCPFESSLAAFKRRNINKGDKLQKILENITADKANFHAKMVKKDDRSISPIEAPCLRNSSAIVLGQCP